MTWKLAVAGVAFPRTYGPFRTPDRARAEELGDVLAEGAFWLLDEGRSVVDANLPHWREFLKKRGKFIDCVLDRVKHKDIEAGEKARMIAALKAALGRLAHIEPELCRDYMQAWSADQQRWRSHIEFLHTGLPRETALRSLTRPGKPGVTWRSGGGVARTALTGRAAPAASTAATNRAAPTNGTAVTNGAVLTNGTRVPGDATANVGG